ncbi:Glycogen synthase [uncultured archaeon]|nr:Glycogen synthase [uncultured archaeon]
MGAAPFLIEVSSEAGRKIGGIYTVVQSKARHAKAAFGGRYLLIGFWDERCAQEVRLGPPPAALEGIFSSLAAEGIFCHYGLWAAADNAPIILLDAKTFAQRPFDWNDGGGAHHDLQVNRVKYLLWKHYGVDSLMDSSWDFSENAVWGWAVGMLLERLCTTAPYSSSRLIAQFHEWICGGALLYAHLNRLPLATVFTTHATVLGRSLAGSGTDVLAQAAASRQPIELSAAYRLKVEGKHQLELAAAKSADIFTTVSDTVASEVRYVLGREPDVITLNGLDLEQMAAEDKTRHLSSYMRQEMLQLVESVITPYYSACYHNALLTFISGRYEFTNKGFDIYISALGQLNARLKKKGARKGKQVIAFIFTPTSVRGPKLSVIRNYLLLDKIHEVLEAAGINGQEARYRCLSDRMAAAPPSLQSDLRQMASGFIQEGERPPVCLFDLNYSNDEVMRAIASAGLRNAADDIVKVFFYPTYIRPDDGLMAMPYYDVVSGFDVGVFPSRYEPFGYTPLEAALKFDIPVSTDAAGFGRYLKSHAPPSQQGAKVLSMGAGGAHAAEELAEYFEHLYYLHGEQLAACQDEAYALMSLFDWKRLIGNYLRAYSMAAAQKFGEAVSFEMPAGSQEAERSSEPGDNPPAASVSKKSALRKSSSKNKR